jgi:hypothetical protein
MITDLPLGGVDAAVIAVAGRMNVTDVATLDGGTLPSSGHATAFTLLPA